MKNMNYLIITTVFVLAAVMAGPLPGIAFAADCIEPIALWKLDEGESATTFQDIQNPGSNAASCRQDESVSVCPHAEEGRDGNGQRFYTNGDHTGIDIPATPIFDWQSKDSYSIAFWMKRGNSPLEGNEVIIGRDSTEPNNNLHWWIGLDDHGAAMAYFADRYMLPGNSGTKFIRGCKLLTDNTWHFIVYVRDGTTSESRLYVDGALEEKIKFTHDTPNAFVAPATDINIGWLNLLPGYYYRGMLDEIALYDLALPQWFIRDRYHADKRYPAEQTGPCD